MKKTMMTVQQLIETLQALPEESKSRIVYLEGCDCVGLWNGRTEHYDRPEWPDGLMDPNGKIDVQGLMLGRDS